MKELTSKIVLKDTFKGFTNSLEFFSKCHGGHVNLLYTIKTPQQRRNLRYAGTIAAVRDNVTNMAVNCRS